MCTIIPNFIIIIIITNTHPPSGMVLREERDIIVSLLHITSKNIEMYARFLRNIRNIHSI